MARYRAIDRLRRRSARPEKNSISLSQIAFATPSHRANPEARTAQRLQKERVRAALAELPEEQRQALALAYFRGYTHREIATALDLPLGTVKTRIRLAMQKLRFLLREEV
jgi:RNA polymerase sigma-70 factor (ECF subfamily)